MFHLVLCEVNRLLECLTKILVTLCAHSHIAKHSNNIAHEGETKCSFPSDCYHTEMKDPFSFDNWTVTKQLPVSPCISQVQLHEISPKQQYLFQRSPQSRDTAVYLEWQQSPVAPDQLQFHWWWSEQQKQFHSFFYCCLSLWYT